MEYVGPNIEAIFEWFLQNFWIVFILEPKLAVLNSIINTMIWFEGIKMQMIKDESLRRFPVYLWFCLFR